jgi:hypothetical protein
MPDPQNNRTPRQGAFRVRSLEEAEVHIASLARAIDGLERQVVDHGHRFDTLQTPWWKRVIFWLDGWPWYDLNGVRAHRPWHDWRP